VWMDHYRLQGSANNTEQTQFPLWLTSRFSGYPGVGGRHLRPIFIFRFSCFETVAACDFSISTVGCQLSAVSYTRHSRRLFTEEFFDGCEFGFSHV
jgi:hypothetical protein